MVPLMADFARRTLFLLLILSGPAWAQTETDSVKSDTTRPVPTVPSQTINDSILMLNPTIKLDTLTDAQRLLVEFETRYRLRQKEQPTARAKPRMSVQDSLTAYYLPARWNLREDIDRSFYHDAGDYFRSDPSYFVLEPQVSPMRKTVQPYGLAGDRMSFLVEGASLHPFEHVVEPDGLVDLNDLPTALDHTVAILPGPVGLVFGADHSVATLYTMPEKIDSTEPRSSFIVDQGGAGYSHTRGRYSKNFTDGRHIDMSIGYRNGDGLVQQATDRAYQYTGNFIIPVGENWDIQADGQLYNRTGYYHVRPLAFGAALKRDRFDRTARVSISRYNADRNAKYVFGYRHIRQESALGGAYDVNLNQTGHGLSMAREWFARGLALRAELAGDYLKYDTWFNQYSRLSADASLQVVRLSRPWGYSALLKQTYAEKYRFLPSVAVMLRRDVEKSLVMFSLGYSERAPSMNELHLPYQATKLYASGFNDYADQGNPDLISEKMFEGTMEVSVGRPDNSLSLTATGGKIWDGIDWMPTKAGALTVFAPQHGDVTFSNITSVGRVRLADFLRFKGGGSYHFVDYKLTDNRAYTPKYQAFSGLELHLFWRQKLIDFWAYGELVYVGRYDGYIEPGLGNEALTNVKLSFRMGHFRFHWIMQNSLSAVFRPRDYWENPGYVTSWGFVWDFFD